MLKVESRSSIQLSPTQMSDEGLSEDDLREWLIQNPEEVLGEDVLIIGREVNVADLRDGIDILAIDKQGNLVVIELKRGALSGSVDIQSLKYASYVSRWAYSDIKQQFEMFLDTEWGQAIYDDDTTFTELLDEFCDDDYEVNASQRIYLIGETVRDRIGSVVLWLHENGIDASAVEVKLFKDADDDLYLDSKTLVPTSDLTKFEKGDRPADEPWNVDGRRWHLEERAKEQTADLIRDIVELFEEIEHLDGPSWTQKFYIAFRIQGTNRILIRTRANLVWLEVYDFEIEEDGDDIVDELLAMGVEEEDVQLDPNYRGRTSQLRVRCQPDDGIDYPALSEYIGSLLDPQE